jgi:hypothetical protein
MALVVNGTFHRLSQHVEEAATSRVQLMRVRQSTWVLR